MYLFILGALATQFTYIAIQWWRLRYKEYLLYGAYILSFGLYTLILFQQEIFKINPESLLYEIVDAFKRPLAFLIHLEYFFFAQLFIDLKNRFPAYYKRIKPIGNLIIVFIVTEIIFRIL